MTWMKIQKMLEKVVFLNQTNKLTIKVYSNLPFINIYYFLKLQIPIMLHQFFKIISQNPDYVKSHCNDRIIPFRFAICSWINQLK